MPARILFYICLVWMVSFACTPRSTNSKPFTNQPVSHTLLDSPMPNKSFMEKTEAEWKKILTPEQYEVTRKKGTERAFTGQFWNHKEKGNYKCVCCRSELFKSKTKYDSGCGWPSFYAPADDKIIREATDNTYGMVRVEVMCDNCGAHLGHVFEDGPSEHGGLRYCINSASLTFEKDSTGK